MHAGFHLYIYKYHDHYIYIYCKLVAQIIVTILILVTIADKRNAITGNICDHFLFLSAGK